MSNFPASNDAGQRIRIHQLPNQQGLAVIQKGAIVSHECSAYRWPLSPTWKNFLLKLLKQRKLLNFSSSKSSSVSRALQDCNSHAESAAVNLSQALPKGCYKPVKPGRVHSNKKQVKRDCKVERGGKGMTWRQQKFPESKRFPPLPIQSKRYQQYRETEQWEYCTYGGRHSDPRFCSDVLLLMYYSFITKKNEPQPAPVTYSFTRDSVARPHLL